MAEQQIDVEVLFKAQGINEIRDAERKLRSEIEKKKEDLRMMVGEGYRDLIDAADTINQMKNLTEKVHSGISSIQTSCDKFKTKPQKRKRTTSEDIKFGNKEINFYALATQMELLVDTPEKIWDALDKNKHLTAAQLYLLGHHIVNTSLPINTGYENQVDVFASFPILHQQWAAISHFKESILKASSAALKDATLPDEMLAESLCSIMLLEDSSPRQVFMAFLVARKAAIQDIFHAGQHKTSIKRQISDITSLVLLTLQQIFNLFYCPDTNAPPGKNEPKSKLYKTIHDVTKKKKTDQGESLQWLFGEDFDVLTVARHLPPIVSGFRPKLRSAVMAVPLQTIQNSTNEWLSRCIADVHEGVEKLLVYIKSVKGLGSIRDTVYDLLMNSRLFGAEVDSSIPVEDDIQQAKNWHHLCDVVLKRNFAIWDEFFESLFINRAKCILESMFTNTSQLLTLSIDETTAQLEVDSIDQDSDIRWDRDMTSFLWQEAPGDLPTSGWGMETSQDDVLNLSSLTLKAKGCTLSVKSLCDVFNNKLGEILKDARFLVEETDTAEHRAKTKKEQKRSIFEEDNHVEPFNKFGNSSEIQAFLQVSSLQLSKSLCSHIENSLTDLKKQLVADQNEDVEFSSLLIDRITLLGRICSAFPEYCINLKCLACGNQEEAKSILGQRSNKYSQRKAKQSESASKYNEIKALFSAQHSSSFSIWEEWIIQNFSQLLNETLQSPEKLIVFGTTCWEDVSIEEEGDSGNKMQSKIRVPAQVSSFLGSLLFRLSEEINRTGGHVLNRSLVKQLTLKIGNSIFTTLDNFVKDNSNNISQNSSLQFMFDVRFLTLLFGGNSDNNDKDVSAFKKRGKLVLENLERFVDPFDLDVFLPHMSGFVNRQLQRSWLLLGTLSNLDNHSLTPLTQRSSSLSQEQHNVVPLAPNPVRFMLLPISNHQEKTNPKRIEDIEPIQNKAANHDISLKSPLFRHLDYYSLEYL